MTKEEKTRALEEENARLKQELVTATKEHKKAEARAHAWGTLIEVGEETLGISILKKPTPNRHQTISRLRDEHSFCLTITETCSLFDVTKQAYYKFNEQVFQTLLLREKMAIDYALSVRAIDPGIGGKKLHKIVHKRVADGDPDRSQPFSAPFGRAWPETAQAHSAGSSHHGFSASFGVS